jgi:hypothetical protein
MKKVDILEIIFLVILLFISDLIGYEKMIVMLLGFMVFKDIVLLKEKGR